MKIEVAQGIACDLCLHWNIQLQQKRNQKGTTVKMVNVFARRVPAQIDIMICRNCLTRMLSLLKRGKNQ